MKKPNLIIGVIVFMIALMSFKSIAQDCDCGKLVEANFQIKGPKEICHEKCDSYLSFTVNNLPPECYKYGWKITNANTGATVNTGGNTANEVIIKCNEFQANQTYDLELTVSCGGKSITTNHTLFVKKCSVGEIKEIKITMGRDATLRSNLGGNAAPALIDRNFGLFKYNTIYGWLASGELPNIQNGGYMESCFLIDFSLPKDLTATSKILEAKIYLFEDNVPNSAVFKNGTKPNKFLVRLQPDAWVEGTGGANSTPSTNGVSWASNFGIQFPISGLPANNASVGFPAVDNSGIVVPNSTGSSDDPVIDVTPLFPNGNFPAGSFNGFIMTYNHQKSFARGRSFGSFQNPDPSKRPVLVLKYQP